MNEMTAALSTDQALERCLHQMKAAQAEAPYPSLAMRRDRLDRLEAMLLEGRDALLAAISEDFSYRAKHEAELLDITLVLGEIRENRRHLKRWMRPRRAGLNKVFWPAKGRIHPQPKGVAGIIAPWNLPIYLALGPLAGVLAAGNRAMIKPSEFTPRASALLADMIAKTFGPTEVRVFPGDATMAAQFSELPFDHLVFTGSTRVGRIVAQAAARNLTPVTLELGGKSPAIIGESADLKHAAERIAFGKGLIAGQLCIAPDYVLLPRNKMEAFADLLMQAFGKFYPKFDDTRDFSAIVSEAHATRLETLLAEAIAAGAEIRRLSETPRDTGRRVITPTLILDPAADLRVMQEEIFGPLLPLIPYDSVEEAKHFVAGRERPLALYLFAKDKTEQKHWADQSISGAMAVNEVGFQTAAMPFGGVGASGMGAYHGRTGFDNFSHLKSVFYQPRLNGSFVFNPPVTTVKMWIARIVQRLI